MTGRRVLHRIRWLKTWWSSTNHSLCTLWGSLEVSCRSTAKLAGVILKDTEVHNFILARGSHLKEKKLATTIRTISLGKTVDSIYNHLSKYLIKDVRCCVFKKKRGFWPFSEWDSLGITLQIFHHWHLLFRFEYGSQIMVSSEYWWII